jgi:uncharacterized protein YacL
MSEFFNSPVTTGALIGIVIALIVFQALILLRIKIILQQISFYIESISRFFYRVGITTATKKKSTVPKTCQFCKNRLSFIHMSENKGEVEDFYYKCQIRNIEISLDDTCEQFEKDNLY